MKKRIGIAFLILVAGYIAYDQFRGDVVSWYFRNYHERTTAFPATDNPDQICLTWSADPRTTQAIQWRTAPAVEDGWIEYRRGGTEDPAAEVGATVTVIADRLLVNDPLNHRFAAVLEGLEAGTAYTYRVGSKTRNAWSDWRTFKTAPAEPAPFSFVYLGDPQLGLDSFGEIVQRAHQERPEAVCYVVAGDLVNAGNRRNEWDDFFAGTVGVFDQRPLVPALGNHDYDPEPDLYLDLLMLPENGPAGFPAERAYHFTYSNALFVVLDSNQPPAAQAAWLEETLAASDALWKFAVYHHPAYASRRVRDNAEVREHWVPLFDQYGVDMALQGHDHAYLRTYPMVGNERATDPGTGTYYVVSVSGTKFYEQDPSDYTAVGFEDTQTYQILDIEMNPDRLTYRAYDGEGTVRDEIIIEK